MKKKNLHPRKWEGEVLWVSEGGSFYYINIQVPDFLSFKRTIQRSKTGSLPILLIVYPNSPIDCSNFCCQFVLTHSLEKNQFPAQDP